MEARYSEEENDDEHRNVKGKCVYCLCDLHSSQSSKGVERYDKLVSTYQVTFLSYTMFPHQTGYLDSFSLRHDEDNELLTDAIHVVFVELSKGSAAVAAARKNAAEIKSSSYALDKAPENLTPHQQLKLDMIAAKNPRLYRAYRIKKSLRLLLKREDILEADIALKKWLWWASHSRINSIVELNRKIRRHK